MAGLCIAGRRSAPTPNWFKLGHPRGWGSGAEAAPMPPLPSCLSAPPPKAAGLEVRKRFWSLGKLWGGALFSAESSSGSRQWPLWERVRKAVLTPLRDLCRTVLGGLACPLLPEQEGSAKLHGPPKCWALALHPSQPASPTPQFAVPRSGWETRKVLLYLLSWFGNFSEPPLPSSQEAANIRF